MRHRTVTTSIDIAAAPAAVWALLCDARMPLAAPCYFRLGVPTPRHCELPDLRGEVGARRRCVTDRGLIEQRITEWAPAVRLGFEVVGDTVGLGTHLAAMHDAFILAPSETGTRLTRQTTFLPRGRCASGKGIVLACAIFRIHRYVMRGFRELAEAA